MVGPPLLGLAQVELLVAPPVGMLFVVGTVGFVNEICGVLLFSRKLEFPFFSLFQTKILQRRGTENHGY